MKTRLRLFNCFLALVVVASMTGCLSSEERKRRKELSSVLIHVEADSSSRNAMEISVIRAAPMKLKIESAPFLDEAQVAAAMVIDQPGGFAIELELTRKGRWLLERVTVLKKGRHLAILGNFGEPRWLAAPLITGKNSTGKIIFTPDATQEEAERFVRGLNNMARKIDKHDNWPFNGPLDK